MKNQNAKMNTQSGFTLVEFIVILSIFAIMAAIALFNFSGFRSNVGINNLTHDIALTIRQAQVFGWATTSGTLDVLANPERRAQGVFFDFQNNVWGKSFVLYSKATPGNSDIAYYDSNTDIVADTITIQGPNRIADIRTASTRDELLIDPATHIPSGGISITQSFSVAFSRPHPEALFFSDANLINDPSINYVGIYVAADANAAELEHVIIVSRLGEIEVQ